MWVSKKLAHDLKLSDRIVLYEQLCQIVSSVSTIIVERPWILGRPFQNYF